MGQSNSSALLAEKCADYPYDDYYGGNINTTEENDYIDPGYLNSDSAGNLTFQNLTFLFSRSYPHRENKQVTHDFLHTVLPVLCNQAMCYLINEI